jgi:hypothetical protein
MSQAIPRISLTAEEDLLWGLARSFATAREWPHFTAPTNAERLDWNKIVAVAAPNRILPLLNGLLVANGLLSLLPTEAQDALRDGMTKATENAARLAGALQQYLHLATMRGLETVVMKGIWLSSRVYGDPTLRVGADIDILVRRSHIQDSLRILEGMDLGRWWPGLMHDRYYARHHLHQMRCSKDIETWFEVHWTLDHPYTLLTTDMDALIDRTTPGELLGESVRDPSLSDLVLSLAVHLVKHAVYLPSVLNRPDLARIILADGMLVYYLDVAEVIKQRGAEMDWPQLLLLARQWGAGSILGCVLRVCHEFLATPVPAEVLAALPIMEPGSLARWAMNRMADHELSIYLSAKRSRLWDFLLLTSGTFFLRPIRILDSLPYFFPDRNYLRRRYGSDGTWTRLRHLVRASQEYARLGVDTLYYSVERYLHARTLPRIEPRQ